MLRVVFGTAIVLALAGTAAAQTEGRISVGASVTWVKPSSDGTNVAVGFGPLVRLNPKRGWGPAAAFNWFRTDLENPDGGDAPFARLRIRPLMGGVAYSVGSERVLTSFSIVAGPSFNSVDFEDEFVAINPGAARIDVENSIIVRPGVGVTWTVAPRVAIIGFGGYAFNRPDIVYTSPSGREFRNTWKADAAVLSVGAVYSIF